MDTKTIRHTVTFKKTPDEIYNMLMNADEHAAFTGESAKIDPEVGGEFSCYSEYITGTNVDLVPGGKIVQSWRGSDWPDSATSTVTYEFTINNDGGTTLEFTHEGVPADKADDINSGWVEHYWNKLGGTVTKQLQN